MAVSLQLHDMIPRDTRRSKVCYSFFLYRIHDRSKALVAQRTQTRSWRPETSLTASDEIEGRFQPDYTSCHDFVSHSVGGIM